MGVWKKDLRDLLTAPLEIHTVTAPKFLIPSCNTQLVILILVQLKERNQIQMIVVRLRIKQKPLFTKRIPRKQIYQKKKLFRQEACTVVQRLKNKEQKLFMMKKIFVKISNVAPKREEVGIMIIERIFGPVMVTMEIQVVQDLVEL